MIPPDASLPLPDILDESPVRVVFARGAIRELGRSVADVFESLDVVEVAASPAHSGRGVLLVTDPGIIAAGHFERAADAVAAGGFATHVFSDVRENPTTEHVSAGVAFARDLDIGLIVALGGGSAMDCAKGINLILSNGGRVQDYWGVNKPTTPMLPLIAVPTTAGTGSEAQSFALITDPDTHQKMACGDRRLPTEGGLRPCVAILDPDLTESQPRSVAAATGLDAITHAVESAGATTRGDISLAFSRAAWDLLAPAFPIVMGPDGSASAKAQSRSDMLLGAHLAGAAIEHAMLGAAHACANPVTAMCGVTHGKAVALMLPHVIRFNAEGGANPYAAIHDDPWDLADFVESLIRTVGFPTRLCECEVAESMLGDLAKMAAAQWTAQFNPRPVVERDMLGIYRAAYD